MLKDQIRQQDAAVMMARCRFKRLTKCHIARTDAAPLLIDIIGSSNENQSPEHLHYPAQMLANGT
jgi:hypothetical protein